MDVLIFCGQSNMQGQSERLSENQPVKDAWEYKYCSNKLLPLCNPVGEDITYAGEKGFAFDFHQKGWDDENAEKYFRWRKDMALGSACFGFTNLVPSFCRVYTKKTKRKVVAIHAAKGDTRIHQWQNGGGMYEIMLQKVLRGIENIGEEVDKIYFIWLQGESDAFANVSKAEYLSNLFALKNSLKRDAKIDRFGIIKVGPFAMDERDEQIRNAQEEACAKDKDFVMLTRISSELLKNGYVNPYYHGHYSAEGLEKLGADAGETLANLVKETE